MDFIDLEKAYDKISCQEAWGRRGTREVPQKYVPIV